MATEGLCAAFGRKLTEEEQALVWRKPPSHLEIEAERRVREVVRRGWDQGEMRVSTILLEGDAGSGKTQIAKALSADLGLPYVKVTCFADMDKSDVLGAILPVPREDGQGSAIEYRYYPSEIVRAYENGWLLEIQEPTVVRDAAVLMALNSALEPDGSLNLPTRIARRHPDFMAVITTNRGYNGCRPLNEALRDRVQHAEKLDLPSIEEMVKRARRKTGFTDDALSRACAEAIAVLDQTAKANAIRGVAGMRSYFFWLNDIQQGVDAIESLYHKVVYKITTDADEIRLLEQALGQSGILARLADLKDRAPGKEQEALEIRADGCGKAPDAQAADDGDAVPVKRRADSAGHADNPNAEDRRAEGASSDGEGAMLYHDVAPESPEERRERERALRKRLNGEAREAVKGSLHEGIGMIVHRPESTEIQRQEYRRIAEATAPVTAALTRRAASVFDYDTSVGLAKNRLYGTRFHADQAASPDLRCFSKGRPPDEDPGVAVALRIDQSASMSAHGRLEATRAAAIAVCEFCEGLNIPLLVYGDAADRSPREKMSLFAYVDWDEPSLNDKGALCGMEGSGNNRDGMALRVLAEKLVRAPQAVKLLISLSDGQPKALPDYSGARAVEDMRETMREYGRRGVAFIAVAIGHDKEAIGDIYGPERFVDVSNLDDLPSQLVRIIMRHL